MVARKARTRKLARSGGPERRHDPIEDSFGDSWANPGRNGERLKAPDFPTYMFGRLTGMIRRSFMPNYVDPFGIGIPEWRVMVAIGLRAPLGFNEICNIITMDRAQVSRTLTALVGKSLVQRETTARTAPRGRGHGLMQTRFSLTPEGREIYQKVIPIAQRHQMILLSALDEQERAVMHRAMQKMIAAAERFEAQRNKKFSRPKRGGPALPPAITRNRGKGGVIHDYP